MQKHKWKNLNILNELQDKRQIGNFQQAMVINQQVQILDLINHKQFNAMQT